MSEILRFAQQLSGLCVRYNSEAWFVPRGSVRPIELYDMAHLHKSHIRSGAFAVLFVPRQILLSPPDWYVELQDINTLSDTLEEEFLSNLLRCTFEIKPPPLW